VVAKFDYFSIVFSEKSNKGAPRPLCRRWLLGSPSAGKTNSYPVHGVMRPLLAMIHGGGHDAKLTVP
jgi:hypothetical protein